MVTIEGSTTIARPVEDVFDFVADERNEPRYNPQMTHVDEAHARPDRSRDPVVSHRRLPGPSDAVGGRGDRLRPTPPAGLNHHDGRRADPRGADLRTRPGRDGHAMVVAPAAQGCLPPPGPGVRRAGPSPGSRDLGRPEEGPGGRTSPRHESATGVGHHRASGRRPGLADPVPSRHPSAPLSTCCW